jgi:hypothetical protein
MFNYSTISRTLLVCALISNTALASGDGHSGNGTTGKAIPIAVDSSSSIFDLIGVVQSCTAEVLKKALNQKFGCEEFDTSLGKTYLQGNRDFGGQVIGSTDVTCKGDINKYAMVDVQPIMFGSIHYLNGKFKDSTPADKNFAKALREKGVVGRIYFADDAHTAFFGFAHGETLPTLLAESRYSLHTVDEGIDQLGNHDIHDEYDPNTGSLVNVRLQLTSPLSDKVELRNEDCKDPNADKTGSCSVYLDTNSYAICVSTGLSQLKEGK